MRGSFIFRTAMLCAVLLLLGVLFSTQSLGTSNSNAAIAAGTPQAATPAVVPPHADWAAIGLVSTGAGIYLLRPRRRMVVSLKRAQ